MNCLGFTKLWQFSCTTMSCHSVAKYNSNGLEQDCSNSIANALQFCTKPSIWCCQQLRFWTNNGQPIGRLWRWAMGCLLWVILAKTPVIWGWYVFVWTMSNGLVAATAGITNNNVIPLLREGYRSAKPRLCPDVIYDLMLKIWDWNPQDRPSFSFLVNFFEDFCIQDGNRGHYERRASQFSIR